MNVSKPFSSSKCQPYICSRISFKQCIKFTYKNSYYICINCSYQAGIRSSMLMEADKEQITWCVDWQYFTDSDQFLLYLGINCPDWTLHISPIWSVGLGLASVYIYCFCTAVTWLLTGFVWYMSYYCLADRKGACRCIPNLFRGYHHLIHYLLSGSITAQQPFKFISQFINLHRPLSRASRRWISILKYLLLHDCMFVYGWLYLLWQIQTYQL